MRLCHVPLAIALLGVGVASAAAEPLCRTVLADGRVVLSEPLRRIDGLSCPALSATARMRPVSRGDTLPSMSFTTGPIGPFTTGSLPPVTGGSLPPLTTFSNSTLPARPETRR